MHQQTGAVRHAPWIALRTRDGLAYFANLLTRETRWLPPHLWMHGWVSRLDVESASALAAADDRLMSRALSTGGRELPCDGRKPLPPPLGRQHVEGGAPYMYEPSLGVPQYPPDERWDSQLTYPLAGNYVRWPRASTPDRQQPIGSGPGGYGTHRLPGIREMGCTWLTVADAEAADAREAAKPPHASGASRQTALGAGTYASVAGDHLVTSTPMLYAFGTMDEPGYSPHPGLPPPRPPALPLLEPSLASPASPPSLSPRGALPPPPPPPADARHRLGQCDVELQEALDEAEYWRDVAALEGADVSTQLELEEAVAEAEYRLAAAASEGMLEGADVSTRLDGGDPEGYAEYCRMAAAGPLMLTSSSAVG